MKKNNLSILVISCDKFQDIWKPSFQSFFNKWNDCPYDVYLGTNEKSFNSQRVTTLLSGEDKDWSSSLRKIISQIETKNILIILEDFFLKKEVENDKFAKFYNFVEKKEFNHCHLWSSPTPDKILDNGIGVYEKGRPYRVNVLGLWNKKYLQKLLLDGENPWNFEIMGSYRTSYDDGFYCLPDGVFDFINCVEKGKWFKEAVEYCKENKIEIDLSKREVLKSGSFLKSRIQILIVKFVTLFSWKKRLKLMNVLRKIFFTY